MAPLGCACAGRGFGMIPSIFGFGGLGPAIHDFGLPHGEIRGYPAPRPGMTRENWERWTPCFWLWRQYLLAGPQALRGNSNGEMAPDPAAADRARRLPDRAESGASHGARPERFRLCLPHLWRHSGLWRLQRAELSVGLATRAIDRFIAQSRAERR